MTLSNLTLGLVRAKQELTRDLDAAYEEFLGDLRRRGPERAAAMAAWHEKRTAAFRKFQAAIAKGGANHAES